MVRAGTQPGPQVPNLMRAHVRVWDRNGTQVFSSLKAKDGIVNDLDTLPPALQEMIRITGMGGIARAWLPPEAMAAWKPGSFPNEELVFELELLGEVPPRAQTVKEVPVGQGSSAAGSGFAPPDLAGAPRDARTTSTGLKFVVQAPGNGPRPTSGSRAGVLVDAWASRGLKLEQVVTGHAVTVSIDSAPAGLGDVLTELATKGRARVWVPPSRATQLFPAHKDVPLIVDVTLTAIESS